MFTAVFNYPILRAGAFTLALASPLLANDASSLPIQQVTNIARSLEIIKQHYVEPISDTEILENALQGMLEQLDPHSTYLNAQALTGFNESTKGEFGGLGIEIEMDNGVLTVISPIDDTPAANAGIQAGDIIIELDGQLIQGMSLSDSVELMRGEPGDAIDLLIKRQGIDKPLAINIVRDIIKITSVRQQNISPKIGYLRIASFQRHTSRDLKRALKTLKTNDKQLQALVLDLRNNPGGLLDQAVAVTDLFLDKKLVVATKGRNPSANEQLFSSDQTPARDLSLVVLINTGSASASEIVAGALQDHNRAVIMGEKSFGKASVQRVFNLSEGNAIKLTIARYFTPSGRSIQAQGIEPDIVVTPSVVTKLKSQLARSEADLNGHLKGDNKEANNTNKTTELDDYQLQQAITLLQGVIILQ